MHAPLRRRAGGGDRASGARERRGGHRRAGRRSSRPSRSPTRTTGRGSTQTCRRARDPPHRRRDRLRLRTDGPLLRERALGAAPGHHVDGQGPDAAATRRSGRPRPPGTSRTPSPTGRCCISTPTRATRWRPRRRSRRSTCSPRSRSSTARQPSSPCSGASSNGSTQATSRVVAISVIGLLSSIELDVADRDDVQDLLIGLRHELYERGVIARCRGRRRDPDRRLLPHARGVGGGSRLRGTGRRRCRRRRPAGGPMTRIVEVREQAVRLEAAIRNSLIDFSQMTVSVVAVITDRVVDGRPVVGLGFNSIGRYAASGILRDRFIPRLLAGRPGQPARRRRRAGPGRDPGSRHEEREARRARRAQRGRGGRWRSRSGTSRPSSPASPSIACWPTATTSGRFDTHVEVYAAGGYYYPDEGADRLVEEMRGYLDQGYTHLKMKIGGASLDEDMARLETVLGLVGRREPARRRRQRPIRPRDRDRLR